QLERQVPRARRVELVQRREQQRVALALALVGEQLADRVERRLVAEQAEAARRRRLLEDGARPQARLERGDHLGAARDQGADRVLAPLRRPGRRDRQRLLERPLGRLLGALGRLLLRRVGVAVEL